MSGLTTGATGLWGGDSGLVTTVTGLSTPPGLEANIAPPAPVTNFIITQASDPIITESGLNLVTE